MEPTRKAYPTDVSDGEWEFMLPYLTLMTLEAPQRKHDLREIFNGLRYLVKAGCQWRMLPHDFPDWDVVYQQTRRWMNAKAFETAAHDLRMIARIVAERKAQPTATIIDSRTLQSTPESGARGGYDGAKKKKGSKTHIAVDVLGNLLALVVTAADQQDRSQVEELTKKVQEATGQNVEVAFVDQGYTGEDAAKQAEKNGIRLEVVKHTEPKKGFVLLPRRWVVERTFGWLGRFRRLARDYERLAEVLGQYHWLAYVALMIQQITT